MPAMTPEEVDAFLRRPLVAVFSTQRPDGSLHSTPVWFEYEDGAFYFWIDVGSVKERDLRQNPETSVCVATQSEPYEYVSVSGHCEIIESPPLDRCVSITRRYYDEARTRAFVEDDEGTEGSLIVLLRPQRWATERSA